MNRRRFLASFGSVLAGGVGALIPPATDAATLDASLSVLEWQRDGDDHVDGIEFRLTNERVPTDSPATKSVEPVVIPWGRGSQAQQNWSIVAGPPRLPAGDSAVYRVETTHTRLRFGQPALLTVYDKGTQKRAWTAFTPTEGSDGDEQ